MTTERNWWEKLSNWWQPGSGDWVGEATKKSGIPPFQLASFIRSLRSGEGGAEVGPEADPSFQAYNDLMKWLQQLSPEDQARVIRDPNSQMFQAAPSGQRWVFKYNEQSGFEEWTLEGGTTEEQGQNQYSIEQMGGWDVQVIRDASGNIIDMQPLDQTPAGDGGNGWSPYEQAKPGIEQGWLDLERQKMGQMNAYQKAQMGVQQQELGLKERQWQTGLRAQPSSWIEAWFAENQPSQTGDTDLSGNPDYQQYLQETGGGQAGSGMTGGGGAPPTVSPLPEGVTPATPEQIRQAGYTPEGLAAVGASAGIQNGQVVMFEGGSQSFGGRELVEGGWKLPQTGEPTKYGDTGGYKDYIPPEGHLSDIYALQRAGAPNWVQAASVWRHPEAMSSITMPGIAGGIAGTAGAYQGIEGISAKLKAGIPLTNEERILYSQTFEGIETTGKTKSLADQQTTLQSQAQAKTLAGQQSWAEDYFKKNPFNI